MKKVIITLICMTVLLISCEGPQGPPGPPGVDGYGQIFEAQVDFTTPDFEAIVDFPSNLEVFNTDIVVAYILDGAGAEGDIWEPLPQILLVEPGTLTYGFAHTVSSIRFFLDGDFNLEALGPIYTDGVIFRVAIIPAVEAQGMDLMNMNLNQVMENLQIKEIQKIQ